MVVAQLLVVIFLLRPDVAPMCISSDTEWRTLPWVLRGILDGLTLAVHRPAGGASLPSIHEVRVVSV